MKKYLPSQNENFKSSSRVSAKNKKLLATLEHEPLLKFLANLNKIVTGQANNGNLSAMEYAEELHNYYENIIACMPNNVYWLDKNCVLLGGNDNLAKMFGLKSRSELVGLTYEQMSKLANWTEGQGESFKKAELEVMTTGIPRFNVDEPPVIVDGKTRFYMSSKVPLYNLKGEVIGVLGISTDITERKQAEAALQEAKEKSEAANKAKTEFLENMRHDIRTPLTGITGFAAIIGSEVSDPKIKEYADNLAASSHALMDLLNEILDVIKMNTGEIPILKKKFNLKKRLDDVIRLNQAKAHQKGIELTFEYDENIPPYIIGDSIRIHRIALELITNALNFTDSGSIRLKVLLANKQESEIIIKLIVEDTGIGIDTNKQQEIFLQFKRLAPSYEGIYKGAGLGLAIVKQFLDELEGEIYVESKVGVGSKFTCIFPLKKSLLDEEFGSDDIIPISSNRMIDNIPALQINRGISNTSDVTTNLSRILVVEDQTIASMVAEKMLSSLACKVDIALDGKAAVQLAQENSYDLIFMDIGLPNIDGYEVTRRIRLYELRKGSHIPIIALTAHGDEENKQRCIEVGMNAVFAKPLNMEKAEDILNTFVPYRKSLQETEAKSKSKEKADLLKLEGKVIDIKLAKKILGVDDNAAYTMLLVFINGFRQELRQIQAAHEKGDWEEVRKIAHKLKGGASYVGTTRLYEACARLEDSILEEKKELLDDLYKQMIAEIRAVEKAVTSKSYETV